LPVAPVRVHDDDRIFLFENVPAIVGERDDETMDVSVVGVLVVEQHEHPRVNWMMQARRAKTVQSRSRYTMVTR
jgi:hypothetical protein